MDREHYLHDFQGPDHETNARGPDALDRALDDDE